MARYDIHVTSLCQRIIPLKVKYMHFIDGFSTAFGKIAEFLRLSRA
jgi:hypothetical protein